MQWYTTSESSRILLFGFSGTNVQSSQGQTYIIAGQGCMLLNQPHALYTMAIAWCRKDWYFWGAHSISYAIYVQYNKLINIMIRQTLTILGGAIAPPAPMVPTPILKHLI